MVTHVRDAPWKKRIDPRKVRGTYPFQRGAPNLQQRSWARCDEDYSCRYKTSCQNQLPQLQGGHVSHKTFSKSTPPVCPSQIQEIQIKSKSKSNQKFLQQCSTNWKYRKTITSTIQLLKLSTEEKKLLQLLYKSSAFVTDFFGEGEITEYRLLHSSFQHTRSSSLATLGWWHLSLPDLSYSFVTYLSSIVSEHSFTLE